MYVMKCVKLKLDKAQDVLLQMSETILSFQARNYMHGWVAYTYITALGIATCCSFAACLLTCSGSMRVINRFNLYFRVSYYYKIRFNSISLLCFKG